MFVKLNCRRRNTLGLEEGKALLGSLQEAVSQQISPLGFVKTAQWHRPTGR
jgi:hypothetical protein